MQFITLSEISIVPKFCTKPSLFKNMEIHQSIEELNETMDDQGEMVAQLEEDLNAHIQDLDSNLTLNNVASATCRHQGSAPPPQVDTTMEGDINEQQGLAKNQQGCNFPKICYVLKCIYVLGELLRIYNIESYALLKKIQESLVATSPPSILL